MTLVPYGKTVFIDPCSLKPYSNQWELLESIDRSDETVLNEIIELNDIETTIIEPNQPSTDLSNGETSRFGFPPCAQNMLQNGVSAYQRVSCSRLAVHFKRLGVPYDMALAALKVWSRKNRPDGGKGIITDAEIVDQTSYAYHKDYSGYGCASEAIRPFCMPTCPLKKEEKNDPSAIIEQGVER